MCYYCALERVIIGGKMLEESQQTEQLLITLREEFERKLEEIDELTIRAIKFPEAKNKIKVAIGIRRSGKTTLVLQHIKHLISNDIPLSRILYINFEDDRLLPMSQKQFAKLLEAFYALYPDNHDQQCYLFLDEVQNVDDWPLVIRRFYDTKHVEIFLTGSSAKLLSKEIATSLRGRSLAREVWPFSFQEYLQAKNIVHNSKLMGQATLDKLKANFMGYLQSGGFPEVINKTESDRRQTLQEYVQVVMLRDIIERYRITNEPLIKYLVKHVLHNATTSFSANKMFNDLKSQGYTLKRDTLYSYMDYIEDAYLAFSVHLYSESLRKVQVNPKKIYAVDTGLLKAYTLGHQENLGRMFENIIYLDLRRLGYQINYYLTEERYEVDFIVKDLQGEAQLLQVAWDTENKETYDRECRALESACNETGLPGKVVTLESYLRGEWL